MKMFLISADEDTLTGMRLAGVDGVLVKTTEDFISACEKAVKSEDIGILLITKTLGNLYPNEIVEIKKRSRVLITEIPDMENPTSSTDSIKRYVRDAVGINIE